jgi:hypothetical protein
MEQLSSATVLFKVIRMDPYVVMTGVYPFQSLVDSRMQQYFFMRLNQMCSVKTVSMLDRILPIEVGNFYHVTSRFSIEKHYCKTSNRAVTSTHCDK